MIGLFEVVIPKMAFKFGASSFNFIKVKLGQVNRLGCFLLVLMLFTPQMNDICNQHLK